MLRKIRSSLKWKLVSLIIAIIVLMVAMIGFFSYYDTTRTIRRDVEHFSTQILRQANLNLNRQYLEYEQGFLVLGTSYEFTQWLQVPPSDPFELISRYRSIELNYMQSFLARHPEVMSISLLSDKGGAFNYALSTGIAMNYSLAREPWLPEVSRSDTIYKRVGECGAYVDENGGPKKMLLFTIAGRFGRPEAKGYLKMDISFDPAQTILDHMQLGAKGRGLIATEDGTILVHQEKDKAGAKLDADIVARLGAQSGSYFRRSTGELIVFDTIPYTGWKTVAIVSYPDVASSINRVRIVTVAVASIGLLIAIVLVTLVTSSVTNRLSRLRTYMRKIYSGNWGGRIQVDGTDEVADLSRAFNRMLDDLDTSVAQLTETKLMQQKAALAAMQSQIHSHFLYNALESINSMAHLAGHADIEKTAISLSRMLRYTANYRDTEVQLQDEIAHVQYYLQICRIRFGEDVSFACELPEDCGTVPCLKAILQPIAENAIKHGIERTGEPTRIEIRVFRREKFVHVVMEDNGTEHDERKLEQFRDRLRQTEREPESYAALTNVGLLNVHYRLQTFYQRRDVGVSIESGSRLGGVKVVVAFPDRGDVREEIEE